MMKKRTLAGLGVAAFIVGFTYQTIKPFQSVEEKTTSRLLKSDWVQQDTGLYWNPIEDVTDENYQTFLEFSPENDEDLVFKFKMRNDYGDVNFRMAEYALKQVLPKELANEVVSSLKSPQSSNYSYDWNDGTVKVYFQSANNNDALACIEGYSTKK